MFFWKPMLRHLFALGVCLLFVCLGYSANGLRTTGQNGSIHRFASQSDNSSGNGRSPTSSSGTATVYGNVWLDSNGDGKIDNGEQGFQGIGVNLDDNRGNVLAATATDANGDYHFTFPMGSGQVGHYKIHVGIPHFDYATIPGYSQINTDGNSAVFALSMGGAKSINVGIRSMNVTTLQDNPNGAIKGQITLRDAIETGNNGPPASAIAFQQRLSGKISLQAQLDAIKTSYNIIGPGANPITVDGGGKSGTIFTVNAGVTSTISDLTIAGGAGVNGGGVYNDGNLTLNGLTIRDCVAVNGGGVYNNGNLTMNGGILTGTQATGNGGGVYAGGNTTLNSVNATGNRAGK